MSKLSRHRNPLDPAQAHASENEDAPIKAHVDERVAELVAEVWEAAPARERGRLIEQLLRPLGVLSLAAIADGIFAGIRLRSGWETLPIRLEDLHDVRASHVMALVEHAQQVSVETVDSLAQTLVTSPALMGSAAAVALVALLLARSAASRRSAPATASQVPRLRQVGMAADKGR